MTLWFPEAKNRLAGMGSYLRADFARLSWSWRGALRWTGIVLAAFIVAILITLYYMDWNRMRGPLARFASARLGRPVRIEGNLSVRLFTLQPHVSMDGLVIANPAWLDAPYAATAQNLTMEIRLLPLLRGALIVPLLQVEKPDILIVRDADGRTNWDRPGPQGSHGWSLPPIRNFVIDQGHVKITDRLRKLDFNGTISSQEQSGAKSAFHLTGSGLLNGGKFLADVRGGPLIHVDESKPYAFSADIRAGTSHAVINGSITHPFHMGEYTAQATFTGADLSDLYYLTGLPMPGTPPYRLSGMLDREGPVMHLNGLHGTIGWSDLTGNLSLDVSNPIPLLRGALASRSLRFEDLGTLFGRPAKPGKPDAALPPPKPGLPGAADSILPDVVLHTERLRQMDAELDYKADKVVSVDFPMRDVTLHVSLENGVLTLKPMTLYFVQGRMSGSLAIDGREKVPVTSTDMRITNVHLENFIAKTDKPVTGVLEARAVLRGHGGSVHDAAATADGTMTVIVPGGTIRRSMAEWLGVNVLSGIGLTLSGDKSATGLRCAVAHFSAQNGVLTAQQFVLDTDPVLVQGSGSVDLGKETVDMRFAGHPKSFQLIRLRAPVTVSGPLDHPTLGVKTDTALLQGGIGAALGILAPPAALLAFVDPGMDKNADCVGLLAQARKQGAPAPSKH
jgi:uncharacterized protein involved in outer membrane biogenesis